MKCDIHERHMGVNTTQLSCDLVSHIKYISEIETTSPCPYT